MKQSKVAIPFQQASSSDVPIVKFHIGQTPYYAIVDTGAESTIFDKSLKNEMIKHHREKISILGVSGETEVQEIGLGTLRLWMTTAQGYVFVTFVNGYINDISHLSSHFVDSGDNNTISAIFGSDMMKRLGADVDFIKKEIRFEP